MSEYKVSIITPSYNQAEYLEQTILSVIKQDYENIEYIIMDGGSTDNSVNIIKKYKSKIIYWESKSDNGQCHAINKGLKISTGEIIGWLNSDDYYKPGAISKVIKVFNNNPDVQIVIGGCEIIDVNGLVKNIKTKLGISVHKLLVTGIVPGQPSVFFKKNVVDNIGYLREDLHLVMDWEYWIRMGASFSENQVQIIDDILSVAREYPGNKTSQGLISKGKPSVLQNDHEKKIILDELYEKNILESNSVYKSKRYYYSCYYINKSIHDVRAGLNKETRKDIIKAITLYPLKIFSIKNVLIFFGSFIGYKKINLIRDYFSNKFMLQR
ncbi:MAG: glycosyltransferase [Bacteroidetes bacterium]|nr:glycosyltransferase [Bacteroidota bacterium]